MLTVKVNMNNIKNNPVINLTTNHNQLKNYIKKRIYIFGYIKINFYHHNLIKSPNYRTSDYKNVTNMKQYN